MVSGNGDPAGFSRVPVLAILSFDATRYHPSSSINLITLSFCGYPDGGDEHGQKAK
jgi:hypothetical protein